MVRHKNGLRLVMPFLVCLSLGLSTANAAIFYTYSTTLNVITGADTGGLDGARFTISFEVPTGATYINRFGLPAVPVANETVTIAGAEIGNNGTFGLPSIAFYPISAAAGFFADPAGIHIEFAIPEGSLLIIRGNTNVTPGSADAVIGSLVELDDFIPSSPLLGLTWLLDDGTAFTQYSLNASVIAAIDTALPVAVPEPGSLALFGAALGAFGLMRRRKKT